MDVILSFLLVVVALGLLGPSARLPEIIASLLMDGCAIAILLPRVRRFFFSFWRGL